MSDLFEHISRKARKIKGKLTSSASISSNLSATTSMTEALRSLHDSAGLFPPLQAAIASLLTCVERTELGSKHRKEFKDLARKLTSLSKLLERHIKTSQSTHVSEFLERLAASVKEQVTNISSRQDTVRAGHLRQAMQDEDEILDGYRRIAEILEELQTEASLKMWNIAEQQLANSHLKSLSPVHLAAYNSSLSEDVNRRACTEGTRVIILAELNQWSVDPTQPNVFWMNGMAGTGKTTIAYTFAKSLRERGALGASFFCTRTSNECQDVRQIVPTIAYQLARHWPSFRSALLGVLEQEPEIRSQAITSQCERLIKDPLSKVKDGMIKGLVVVIDALDECSNPKGVGTILDALFRIAPGLPVKFFVTSRPEADIRHRVEAQPGQNRLMCVLHDIEESLVQADITLYLRAELASSDVSEFNVTQLASLSGKLFIYAATAVRYIRQAGTMVDQDRLEAILSSASDSDYRHSEINQLYTTILDTAVYQSNREPREQEWMRLILWTAVCTREPVTIDTLAALAGIKPAKATILLQSLYSVLHVSQVTNMVSTHASFPDYIFDEARSKRFYCDETTHSQLLSSTASTSCDQLRFNICGLETSFIADSEVKDLKARIDRSISPTLSYAAHHWGHHVAKRTLDMGIAMLSLVKPWLTAKESPSNLVKILDDSWIFVSTFAAGSGSQSTPHIYISALAFCHPSSWVSQQYKGPVALGPLRGTRRVTSVALSPDGSMLASGSGDGTILVRDAQTGNPIYDVIRDMKKGVNCAAFSPDGKHIACVTPFSIRCSSVLVLSIAFLPNGNTLSLAIPVICASGVSTTAPPHTPHPKYTTTQSDPLGFATRRQTRHCSDDRCVYIWDVENGYSNPCLLGTHDGYVYSAAFSPDGTRVASCSDDCTVKMWNPLHSTSAHTPRWKAPTVGVSSVSISPDGSRIAAAGDKGDLYVQRTQWHCHRRATCGTHRLDQVDSILAQWKRIVSASQDKTIRMWDVGDETLTAIDLVGTHEEEIYRKIRMWDSHSLSLVFDPFGSQWHNGSINSVTFSPDGQLIASGSDDEPSACLTRAVAICHIVSGSDDGSVRAWAVKDGAPACEPLRGHQDRVTSVACSPDGRYIVSGSYDLTIRVWKAPGGGVVSDLSHSAPSASDERQTHRAIAGGLTVSQDGWIRNHDSQLVFWAPPIYTGSSP
ncbi:WD40 repeat-like protein [Rhizoctonia solani]|uniref:WD40 repeat-like protein n=1 Tax=Rhizoctonia solani TaxID=456999 RepID=A0A8H7I4I7_9AGAM|nr:WD40 repeat-like protein [Rhizoctonia solani]